MESTTDIKQRLQKVREHIEKAARDCRRDPATVQLVAVSKTMPAERVKAAIEAGATVLGENYIQEAREKFDQLAALPAAWHFIGHLQTNKAKYAVRIFDLIHSVDSFKLARELDKQAAKVGKIQEILVQVNVSAEATKSGIAEQEALALASDIAALEHVALKGLMTMPPFFDDPQRARPYFRALRQISGRIQQAGLPTVSMDHLSMGMTGDFEAAIQEGATLVRIGTAIFGPRR